MGIPLFGLPDTATVKRETASDADYGMESVSADTTVVASIKCRFTVPNENDDTLFVGRGSGEPWKITMAYNSDVQRNDLVEIVKCNILSAGDQFRVLSVRHQRDYRGRRHHLLLGVEKE
jgi:hypothetical protein